MSCGKVRLRGEHKYRWDDLPARKTQNKTKSSRGERDSDGKHVASYKTRRVDAA